MDKSHIAVLVAVFVALAFRLYKKYGNKNKGITGDNAKKPGASFPSTTKDEEYEPYSKK
jgi:hypothetical protein